MSQSLFSEDLEQAASRDEDFLELAKKQGISQEEALKQVREASIKLSKKRIEGLVGRDELIIQAVSALDELNDTINLLANRLREWYGLHAPERFDQLSSPEQYVRSVQSRDGGSEMGIELKEKDYLVVERQAKTLSVMMDERKALEKYLEELVGELAPNLSEIAGHNLSARLIAKAGSLKRLARQPSSTIQVYGAERALFKHMIKGTPCPKHGLIFQHPSIMGSKKSLRGKLARALAGKLAIAARIDYYSTELNPDLMEDWESRLSEIKGEKR